VSRRDAGIPTLDSLAETLAEIAAPDVLVAETVSISNRLW
jgi:hypothetical protein